jgi:hypothetical protein
MAADARPDAAQPMAEQAGQQPTSRETKPTAAILSRQSTDFGIGADARSAGPTPPAGPDPLEGHDFGDVVLGRLIAQGGMGRVYEAQQRSPSRTVAVKLMRPSRRSPAAVQRFHREADLLGRLRHPGIAQVFTAGSCFVDGEQTPYFVMEFVAAAETLVQASERRGLTPRQRLETFLDVCRAVAHGHAAGIVHRDLKPGNILVDGDGRPKVIDFGIARLAEDDPGGFTETGAFLGTRQYSSPEQCTGTPVDARTDVYSLGVILHELLSGQLPYDVTGTSLAETTRIVQDVLPVRLRFADQSLAPGADAIALKCLAKRPLDRYPSAAELAADLERLLAGRATSARPPGLTDACRTWCRRHKTFAVSGLAAVVSAVLVAGGLLAGRVMGPAAGTQPAAGPGPTAAFPNISSLRTTPLQWLTVTFDEPIRSLSPADFRLTREGAKVSLEGVTVTGDRTHWEIRGLERMTTAEGGYVLELAGTATTPIDLAGRRLHAPAQATWRMPPYREVAFNLLGDEWRRHVVSMKGVEFATERNAGATSFIRPTEPGREGSIVLRFESPFEIRAATLNASIAVWTTGDPFPYDPRAKAALDVSPDGKTWTTLETREANRGGFGGGPFDIREFVAGSREVWVRARLTASKSWPGDGLIYAQFLRTNPERPADRPFKLTLTGPDPAAKPPPDDTPPADG